MKRMLVNATQEEELRLAMVDGQKIYDLDIEVPSRAQKKANIYKGKISRIEPSLDAAFVNYGADRNGFLPLKDISREYFVREPEPGTRLNIKNVLNEGQDIVVQVEKEERGNKGAALTTFISLAGRFIVLMPNNPRAGGVSRRITGENRDEIRDALRELEVPGGMGAIVRTAGVGRSDEELSWDLDYLLGIWESIKSAVVSAASPTLIFQDSSPIIRAIRDHLSSEIGEILIDDEATFGEAREFMEHAMPHNLRKLKFYKDSSPLFTRFQIESQIESAFAHTVQLPSGGSIVIDHTEALVSIDINSARATKGSDIEATAFATNLEAADEVARQCRLRDLGGLLVIDFIDMRPERNQREVENRLREAVKADRARVQLGRISRFGLLEMSRQRLRPSLGESTHKVCPRCNGIGNIRTIESLALAILRLIGEEARKEGTAKLLAQLPVDVATYLLNEKRDWIQHMEERDDVQIILVANPALETPNYSIRRIREDETVLSENTGASYSLVEPSDDIDELSLQLSSHSKTDIPAVTDVKPSSPAPTPIARKTSPRKSSAKRPGLLARIAGFFSAPAKPAEKTGGQQGRSGRPQQRQRRQGGTSAQNRGRGGRGSRRRDDRTRTGGKPDRQANQNQRKTAQQSSEGDSAASSKDQSQRPKRNRRRRRPADSAKKTQPVNESNQATTIRDGESGTDKRNRQPGPRQQKTGNTASNGGRQKPPEDKASAPSAEQSRSTSSGGSQRNGPAPAAGRTEPDRPTGSEQARQTQHPGDKTAPHQTKPRTSEVTKEPSAPKENASPQMAQPEQKRDTTPGSSSAKANVKPEQAQSKEDDRRLPWEPATPKESSESYTVWSSSGNDDDRGRK